MFEQCKQIRPSADTDGREYTLLFTELFVYLNLWTNGNIRYISENVDFLNIVLQYSFWT